jgi:hypothetical protein
VTARAAPAAVTPPAPAPAPPADQQQAQPPVPAKPTRDMQVQAKNDDGTFTIPEDQVTLQESLSRNQHIYSPQELQARGVIIPENPQAAQDKFVAVQKAQEVADAARRDASALYGTMKDPSDALKQMNAANEAAQKARQDYDTYIGGLNKDNAANLQAIYKDQDALNATAWNNAKAQAAQLGREKEIEQIRQSGAVNLENIKAGNADRSDALKTVNTNMAAASDRIDQLQLLRGLSENAGDVGMLGGLSYRGKSLADIVGITGFGTQDMKDKASAIQAFRNGVLNLTRSLREGGAATGEPRSNQDLNFVLGMAPNEYEDPRTREAIISYLQQINQRHLDLGAETSRLMHTYLPGTQTYMPYGQALQEARATFGDMLPQVPKDLMTADHATQWKWFEDNNIKPYTFIRYPGGGMGLYKGRPE